MDVDVIKPKGERSLKHSRIKDSSFNVCINSPADNDSESLRNTNRNPSCSILLNPTPFNHKALAFQRIAHMQSKRRNHNETPFHVLSKENNATNKDMVKNHSLKTLLASVDLGAPARKLEEARPRRYVRQRNLNPTIDPLKVKR